MDRAAVLERLNEVFVSIFDDDSIVLTEDVKSDDIEDWDSLEHINIITACEEEFGMKFSFDEISNMNNIGEMITTIQEKLKND